MKPTFENEDQVRKEMGEENFKIVNDITQKIVGDIKPLSLRDFTEAQIDNIFERPRSIKEVFEATGSVVYDVDLILENDTEPTNVFVCLFTPNLGVLSIMDEKHKDTYIGCYKRDEDKYVFFDEPIVVPEDEESRPYYQKAIATSKEIFSK